MGLCPGANLCFLDYQSALISGVKCESFKYAAERVRMDMVFTFSRLVLYNESMGGSGEQGINMPDPTTNRG